MGDRMLLTMGDAITAIAWGIPVKPVDLLCSLDAFRKAIPTIHTLRLCNQFGTGENAGITKLPKELIESIGEELLASLRQDEMRAGHHWSKRYRCFEGKGLGPDHVDGLPPELTMDWDDGLEDAKRDLLKLHPEWQTEHGLQLPDNYRILLEKVLAEKSYMYAENRGYEVEDMLADRWKPDVRKHMEKGGNSDVLRKHFGLDAFIMHEILDTSTDSQTMNATICYLVLPSQTAQWETHLDAELRNLGSFYGQSATSMLVDRSSLDLTDEHQRRFARVMLRLALKPSVHPSQLRKNLSATSTINKPSSTKKATLATPNEAVSEHELRDLATTRRIKGLEQSQWPKLMLLTSQVISET